MTNASIFISHSVKDAENAPPPDAGAELRERWRRLCVARKFRSAVKVALEALGTVDPWLDQRDIEPGVLWRDAIHDGLLRCDGAVLLLTPESLESSWVLKEATILTWMQALGFPIRIVPVFMGVGIEDLDKHGFGPVSVDAIQALQVTVEDLDSSDQALEAKARDVAARFAGVATSSRDSALDAWARQLTSYWGNVPAADVRKVMRALGMSEWQASEVKFKQMFHDPGHCAARELLLSGWDKAVDAFEQLSGLNVSWHDMGKCVQPLWVPAAAVKILPLVTKKPPGTRTILVAGTAPATGRDVVMRAYCGGFPKNRVLWPTDTGDDPETLIERLEDEMRDLGVGKYIPVCAERPFFLVLGNGAATPAIVEHLRTCKQFEQVTYVVMAARDRASLLRLDPPPFSLEPDLGAECEEQARVFARHLVGFGR